MNTTLKFAVSIALATTALSAAFDFSGIDFTKKPVVSNTAGTGTGTSVPALSLAPNLVSGVKVKVKAKPAPTPVDYTGYIAATEVARDYTLNTNIPAPDYSGHVALTDVGNDLSGTHTHLVRKVATDLDDALTIKNAELAKAETQARSFHAVIAAMLEQNEFLAQALLGEIGVGDKATHGTVKTLLESKSTTSGDSSLTIGDGDIDGYAAIVEGLLTPVNVFVERLQSNAALTQYAAELGIDLSAGAPARAVILAAVDTHATTEPTYDVGSAKAALTKICDVLKIA